MEATLAHLGRVDHMPHAAYHAVSAMSNSALRNLRKSPWHFKHPAPREQTREMLLGTVTHALMLEYDTFDERYFVGPSVSKNSNVWKQCVADHPQHVVIDADMHETAAEMVDALHANPEVARLFQQYPGASEVSFFWHEHGRVALREGDVYHRPIYSKARIDRLLDTQAGWIVLDLKTGSEMTAHAFATSAAKLGYAHQACWYTRGVEKVTGRDVVGYVVIAVESTLPHGVTTFMFDEPVLARTNAHIDGLLDLYAECETEGIWPGYPESQLIQRLPEWAYE